MVVGLGGLGCAGGGSIEVTDTVGLPSGDKEGAGLSGTFLSVMEYTSDGCADVAQLEVPATGTQTVITVEVTQDEGAITFEGIGIILRGGVEFDNTFAAGGAMTISRGGDNNILQLALMDGSFEDANNFDGSGESRMQGRIATEFVDCTFTFNVSGIRQ